MVEFYLLESIYLLPRTHYIIQLQEKRGFIFIVYKNDNECHNKHVMWDEIVYLFLLNYSVKDFYMI